MRENLWKDREPGRNSADDWSSGSNGSDSNEAGQSDEGGVHEEEDSLTRLVLAKTTDGSSKASLNGKGGTGEPRTMEQFDETHVHGFSRCSWFWVDTTIVLVE